MVKDVKKYNEQKEAYIHKKKCERNTKSKRQLIVELKKKTGLSVTFLKSSGQNKLKTWVLRTIL